MSAIQKRQGSVFEIPPEMQERIDAGQCPVCGKHRDEWGHKRNSRCCSPPCTEKLLADHWHTWKSTRNHAAEAAGWQCQQCKKPLSRARGGGFDGVVDHIIPIALGGDEFDPSNLQLLCEKCNKEKTKRDQGEIAAFRRAHGIKPKQSPRYDYSPTRQSSLESFTAA